MKMNCFHFSNGEKSPSWSRKSRSTRSNSTRSSDRDRRRCESDSNTLLDMFAFSGRSSRFPSLSHRPNNLKVFTFKELKNATNNFSRALMIGEGGFGCVYRGTIHSPKDPSTSFDVAIKRLNRGGLQGHKEWITEVDVLGVAEHPNLVKLIGCCAENDERGIQRLLVYEYMPNRSVEDHLSVRFATTLSWPTRLGIALDTARGLTYLHEEGEFQVIGTMGYAAPEYIQTGRLTAKSDIWAYGIVLYELITGRKPMDQNRPKKEQNLLEWLKPYTADVKKFHTIVDPRIQAEYSLEQAMELASIANKCLARSSKLRPKMSEVLEMVERIVRGMEIGTHPFDSNPGHKVQYCREESERKDLKRQVSSSKVDEGRWFMWRPKLLRAQ
ncbi:serine/threonine-protein kinase PCRK1-like isoform X3 [Zingiber officinale]|uniref:serine/threonine-protein kinase PCRK1-like isoform X3 n=1 Tax=Zingiber officinale TaxID=94328 RepID=UPI001C4ACF10|nr:serine/threonine-protein kinase PCRK1-like isoform X3 [Zingiber officinale]